MAHNAYSTRIRSSGPNYLQDMNYVISPKFAPLPECNHHVCQLLPVIRVMLKTRRLSSTQSMTMMYEVWHMMYDVWWRDWVIWLSYDIVWCSMILFHDDVVWWWWFMKTWKQLARLGEAQGCELHKDPCSHMRVMCREVLHIKFCPDVTPMMVLTIGS